MVLSVDEGTLVGRPVSEIAGAAAATWSTPSAKASEATAATGSTDVGRVFRRGWGCRSLFWLFELLEIILLGVVTKQNVVDRELDHSVVLLVKGERREWKVCCVVRLLCVLTQISSHLCRVEQGLFLLGFWVDPPELDTLAILPGVPKFVGFIDEVRRERRTVDVLSDVVAAELIHQLPVSLGLILGRERTGDSQYKNQSEKAHEGQFSLNGFIFCNWNCAASEFRKISACPESSA